MVGVGHEPVVVFRVFVVGDEGGSFFKGEFPATDVGGDGIQSDFGVGDFFLRDARLEQNVPHVDFIAAFVDELDDVIAEFGLDDFRDFLWIGEVEGCGGEGRIECSATGEAEFSALPCATWVF